MAFNVNINSLWPSDAIKDLQFGQHWIRSWFGAKPFPDYAPILAYGPEVAHKQTIA